MVLATFTCMHVVARASSPPPPLLHFRQKKTGSERLRNLFHRVSWASLPTKLIIESEIFLTWTLGCCHLLPFFIFKSMATGHHRALCEPPPQSLILTKPPVLCEETPAASLSFIRGMERIKPSNPSFKAPGSV